MKRDRDYVTEHLKLLLVFSEREREREEVGYIEVERVQDLRILEKMEFVEKKQNDIYFLIIIVCKVSSTLKY